MRVRRVFVDIEGTFDRDQTKTWIVYESGDFKINETVAVSVVLFILKKYHL